MAETVSLIRRADGGTTNISSLEIFSGTSTLSISDWTPQVMGEDDTSVIETMRFRVNGTSDNHLATITQGLAQKVREARWSKEPSERYFVWLNDQLSGETNARQAVIMGMKVESGNFFHGYPTRQNHIYEGLTVALERGHWENTTPGTFTASTINALGGTFAIGTSAITGDIPARLCYFKSDTIDGAVKELWWGFKSDRNVTLANWTGLWQLELGSVAGSATASADATASNGSAILNNFSSGTAMSTIVTLYPIQIAGANDADLRGTYQIILRAKADSGYTCRARVFSGMVNGTSYNDPVTVNSANWFMYDMGRITLPCGGPASPELAITFDYSKIGLQAELYSGTQGSATYFRADCIIAIPVDEGYGHFANCTNNDGIVLIDPLGRVQSYNIDSTDILGVLETDGTNSIDCVLPVGNVVCILAGQAGTISSTAYTTTITGKYYPRWQLLRGSS